MGLRDLQNQIENLRGLGGLERVREARRLSDVALAELAAAGDAGVWEATRNATYAEVAEELGVTVWAVGKAVRRHNARRRALTERTDTDIATGANRARTA